MFSNFSYFLIVTEFLDDGRMLCCFYILKTNQTKKKNVICEACLDAMAEFVLGAQLMMYPKFV